MSESDNQYEVQVHWRLGVQDAQCSYATAVSTAVEAPEGAQILRKSTSVHLPPCQLDLR